MKIMFVGPQGSGKSTYAKMLHKEMGLPFFSVGQLLRDVPEGHPRYEEVNDHMDRGVLAPYQLTADLIQERISKDDALDGYIMDGWARSMEQLDYFNPELDYVVYFSIPREVSLQRISGRRICEDCGWMCNIYTLPPKSEGHCDQCNGELTQRHDDTEEAVNVRLDIFYNETLPVIEMYREKGILVEVNAEPLPEKVFEELVSKLGI